MINWKNDVCVCEIFIVISLNARGYRYETSAEIQVCSLQILNVEFDYCIVVATDGVMDLIAAIVDAILNGWWFEYEYITRHTPRRSHATRLPRHDVKGCALFT